MQKIFTKVNLNNYSNNRLLFRLCFGFILIIFATAYCLASIVPHYLFRTYALDLGMFNNALYNYAHLHSAHFTLAIDGTEIPYLGDHFSPITMLYAPFYYLFGSYTLLIIQIVSILFGGYSIFAYARFKGINKWISLLLMAHFLILWPIFSALSFDFHNNVVAAMLIPWFVLQFEKGNLKQTLIFFVLILMAKENMALWMAFILMGLLLLKKGKSSAISNPVAIGLAVFSVIYFLVVILEIMPAYSKGLGTDQLARYSKVSGSPADVFSTMILNPVKYFSLLFEDTISADAHGVKSMFWFMFLISGGFALIYKPQYLLMILPIIAQKMFSSNPAIWGTGSQYSIEMAPMISLALIAFLPIFKTNTGKAVFLAVLIFTSYYYNKDEKGKRNIPIFRAEHYEPYLDIKEAHQAFKLIPDDVVISVNSELAPHLAFRKVIYHFPVIKDAEYIVLLKNRRSSYPLTKEQFDEQINKFSADSSNVIYNSADLLIYHVVNNSVKDIKISETYDLKKLEEIENYIRSSKEWYDKIKRKAKIQNLPVDSVLRDDAKWAYRKNLNK